MVERELFPLFLHFAPFAGGKNCLDRFRLHCKLLQEKEMGRASYFLEKLKQKSHQKKRALDSDLAIVVEIWGSGQFPDCCWFGGRRRDSVYMYTISLESSRPVFMDSAVADDPHSATIAAVPAAFAGSLAVERFIR
jgi:hypothetical protein